MEAVIPDVDGAWYGYYHNEWPAEVCDDAQRTMPRIGAARSRDFGATWEDLGIILEAPPGWHDCGSANRYFVGGVGDFSVMLDHEAQYLYFFFSQYASRESAQGVVGGPDGVGRPRRSRRPDVGLVAQPDMAAGPPAAARGPTRVRVLLSGRHADLSARRTWHDAQIVDAFWGPSVHWNTYLEQYVMLLNRARDAEWKQEGIYVAFSPSLDDPSAVVDAAARCWTGGSWYPQVLGTEPGVGTDKIAGERARLFVSGRRTISFEFEK